MQGSGPKPTKSCKSKTHKRNFIKQNQNFGSFSDRTTYERYLQERARAFPDLIGARFLHEIRELGYEDGYTAVTGFLREVRPARLAAFERRFETPPGKQAQDDFAEFAVEFTDEQGVVRKVWLFSLVLGHSRWLWGRFVASQNLQSVLRCHIASFLAIDGVLGEILYGRMKTAVIGKDEAREKIPAWQQGVSDPLCI